MAITTPDDLLRLAPDAKTLEAGRRLFYSRHWRLVGGNGEWLWGEFPYGNSGKASKTAVELMTGKFYCDCRGRSRPCAHGLALVLMLKNAQERITVGNQPPSWVRSLQFQEERQTTAKPVKHEHTADKNRAARLELMTAGVEELELRLLDITRRGIADTLAQGPDLFLTTAARLTDAKLGGLAGQFRRLAALGSEGTEADVARTLGDLYLFIRSWKNQQNLPPERREELLQYAGLNVRKDELLARPGLEDHWLVLGSVEEQDDRLRYRRVWLRGEKSRRFALLLDYVFGERAPFERSWPLGASFQGGLYYYPGSYPQRAVFPHPVPGGRAYDGLRGYADFAAMRENYGKALTVNPWVQAYPVYLQNVRPALDEKQQAVLVDANGEVLPLVPEFDGFYTLLAVSGGAGIKVFGEFDGYRVRPLSIVAANGLVAL